MGTYEEIMKRKDRNIESCKEIESVLKDFQSNILTIEDAKLMIYMALQDAKSSGYKDGWSGSKRVKKKR
jgi:hypothetical protein